MALNHEPTAYAGGVWAAGRWLADNPALRARLLGLGDALVREFGLTTRLAAPLVGRYVLRSMSREDERLRSGWTYEPTTFYESNQPLTEGPRPAEACRWVCLAPAEP